MNIRELPKKHWEFGTRRNVRVIHVEKLGECPGQKLSSATLLCCADTETREGWIILQDPALPVPMIGAPGVIEFKKGGPFNGHWEFEPCATNAAGMNC